MEILNVLIELLGETIHITVLNASTLGVLLSTFVERFVNRRK